MAPSPLFALLGLGFLELLVIIIVLGGMGFWLWMLIDCVARESDENQKILWVLVIALTGIIGALIYLFVRKLARKAPPPIAPSGMGRPDLRGS